MTDDQLLYDACVEYLTRAGYMRRTERPCWGAEIVFYNPRSGMNIAIGVDADLEGLCGDWLLNAIKDIAVQEIDRDVQAIAREMKGSEE